MSAPTNPHEELGRARKVAKLAAAIPCGATTEEITRIADFFAALPQEARTKFAEDLGIKPPSEATWADLITALRARKTF